jgi:hypothetical protein
VEDSEFGDLANIEQPWFKSLIGNIKDFVSPPKLPPLEITSKSVEVPEIWGAYGERQGRSGVLSVLIHIGVIVLLLVRISNARCAEEGEAGYRPLLPAGSGV